MKQNTKEKSCEKWDNAERKTEWISLCIASSTTFFTSVQFTIYFASIWPFLLQIDPDITEEFFGYTNAVYSLGQAVMCPVFGYWCNRVNQCRLPILTGVLVMCIGNWIYLLSPILPVAPRWTMFVSRLVTGCGAGVITILRNYAVTASTLEDRSRSISLNAGCFALGLTIGPAIQIIFTPFGYPGFQLGAFGVNMYTAPAYFGILMNTTCFILVVLFFRESNVGIMKNHLAENDDRIRFFALPKPDKIAIAACITTRFAQMFVITNLETIGSPLTMTMFSLNKQEAVQYNALMHGGFGLIGFVFYAANVCFNVGANANHRIGTILGLGGLVVFHLITYPWWFLPGKIAYQEPSVLVNGSWIPNPDPIGCRPTFEWCATTPPINKYVYIVSYAVIGGLSFTAINICMNTVFSTVLGPRNQGTMQGFLMLSGSVARMCGPVVVASLFTWAGPRPAWLMEIVFAGGSALIWILFYKRLVPLQLPKNMPVGTKFKNKFGPVYKF